MGLFTMLLSYGATSAVLSNCGTPNDLATINSYGLSPVDPVVNENVTMWIDYTLNKNVYSGIAVYEANLNGFPYYDEQDLCTQTECPILSGEHNETSSSVFPEFSGRLITTITWFDEYDDQILCVRATFKA